MKSKSCLLLILLLALAPVAAHAQKQFTHVETGEILDLDGALPDGRDTPAVQHFLQTGENLYNENPSCLHKAQQLYLTACSACHGHYAEGKLGPGLADDHWTYPEGLTDEGLFAIIFGGARGQMGPQSLTMTLDDMLLSMAWVRHLYGGDPANARWLTQEQRARFTPFDKANVPDASASCEVPVG